MKLNAFREPGVDANHPSACSPARHYLVITLIGLAAIAVSLVAMRDEPKSPVAAPSAAAQETVAAASAVANELSPRQNAARSPAPVDKPFDYFPAQFPTPSGDAGEQPPTF